MRSLPRLLSAATLASLATSATPVHAATPSLTVDRSVGKVAGWSIGYNGSAEGCLAAASYGDGTTIWFGLAGATGQVYLAFTNPRWRSIEPGQSYDISLHTLNGGSWKGTFAGLDRAGSRGLYQADVQPEFINGLAGSGRLTLEWQGRSIAALSLSGSMEAFQAVLVCQKVFAGTQAKTEAPAPGPAQVPARVPIEAATHFLKGTPADLPAIAASPTSAVGLPEAGSRIALVIGNAAYRTVPTLTNPNGDAEAVAGTLRFLGFSVRLIEDATLPQMKDALRDFQTQADDADWALVYYAGHGIEISGQNYLIPIDARLRSDQDADDEAVSLRYVLDKMRNARKLHLVILDACRENPFQTAMKRRMAARAVQRGLAPYEPRVPSEMVIYSAKDGEQAMDGSGADHSPFAKALVARMTMPGVEINKVFRLVTADVLTDTHNQQQPFVYGSTPGVEDFFFRSR